MNQIGTKLTEMLASITQHIQNTENALAMDANSSDPAISALQTHLKTQVDELDRGIRVFADSVHHEEASLHRAEDLLLALEVQYSHLNYLASQTQDLKPSRPPLPAPIAPIAQIRRVMERPGDKPIQTVQVLCLEEYEMIPKYLLGRTTLDRYSFNQGWLTGKKNQRLNSGIQQNHCGKVHTHEAANKVARQAGQGQNC